jgi:transcriptional regulator GlxA family with amidase domain
LSVAGPGRAVRGVCDRQRAAAAYLALALVEQDCGRELSAQVARQLVVFVRRAGGQAQFSAQLALQSAEREPIRESMAWVLEHPEARLDVPTLAQRAHMSVRNFARSFRAETGSSPAAFVERVRVETARRLLETHVRSSTRRSRAWRASVRRSPCVARSRAGWRSAHASTAHASVPGIRLQRRPREDSRTVVR